MSLRSLMLACVLFGAVWGCQPAPARDARTHAAEPAVVQVPAGGEGASRRLYYVPIYSHIYYRDSASAFDLAATLSVRNTDPTHPLRLTRVDYFDTGGRLLRRYVSAPGRVGPLATAEFVIPSRDATGGSGANFLIELETDSVVTEPVVEAVMVGISGNAGVSFISPARLLRRP